MRVALAQRWWGGEGQAPGINLIPLEVFLKGVDRLRAEGCNRIAVLGTSRCAEAALLTAVRDPRIEIAIAISPSHVVWQDFRNGLWLNNPDIYQYNLNQQQESPVSRDPAFQEYPAVDGDRVVWEDQRRSQFGNIRLYDQKTGVETIVSASEFDQTNPAISGDIVV